MTARAVAHVDVWYDDGQVRDGTGPAWSRLPDDGVQLIIVHYQDARLGTRALSGHDHYFRADGPDREYIYGSSDDSADEIEARYTNPVILRGRWTTDQRLYQLMAAAALEP